MKRATWMIENPVRFRWLSLSSHTFPCASDECRLSMHSSLKSANCPVVRECCRPQKPHKKLWNAHIKPSVDARSVISIETHWQKWGNEHHRDTEWEPRTAWNNYQPHSALFHRIIFLKHWNHFHIRPSAAESLKFWLNIWHENKTENSRCGENHKSQKLSEKSATK